jgi:hypothetical protein
MITAAEAQKASKEVNEILVSSFLELVDAQVRKAALLGKRTARVIVTDSLDEHMVAQSPTFLAVKSALESAGYRVYAHFGILRNLEVLWE